MRTPPERLQTGSQDRPPIEVSLVCFRICDTLLSRPVLRSRHVHEHLSTERRHVAHGCPDYIASTDAQSEECKRHVTIRISCFLYTRTLDIISHSFQPHITGISVKTQELFLLVFLTRYLDLFTTFYSLYNSCLKVFYIAVTAFIIYMIRCNGTIRSLYNFDQDAFPHWKGAVAPCAVITFLTHLMQRGVPAFSLQELLWTFSIYLEAIAILPQLVLLRRYRLVENLTGKFMLCLGSYRALYIVNWIYRSYTERGYYHHWVVYTCGVVQTLLYVDFFYQYIQMRCGCCGNRNRSDDEDDDTRLLFEQELSESRTIEVSDEALIISGGDVDAHEQDSDVYRLTTEPVSGERRRQSSLDTDVNEGDVAIYNISIV